MHTTLTKQTYLDLRRRLVTQGFSGCGSYRKADGTVHVNPHRKPVLREAYIRKVPDTDLEIQVLLMNASVVLKLVRRTFREDGEWATKAVVVDTYLVHYDWPSIHHAIDQLIPAQEVRNN